MEQQVQKIEGISPDMLWTFCVVLVGLCALFILGHKVYDIIRTEQKKKREQRQLEGQDITDQIADKVLEKLTPQIDEKFSNFERTFDKKFEDIDKKLSSDKENIELHTRQLNDHESRVSRLESGNDTLCQGMLALLERDPALNKAAHAMKNYLITGRYNEKDWE